MTSSSLIALTRAVSPKIAECQLTFIDRQPIDFQLAREQHQAYRAALEKQGAQRVALPEQDSQPDGVFVEDPAVVLDEIAVINRMGNPARQGEVEAVAQVLESYRPLARMTAPATLDGGDVLRIERTLIVGLSVRTNREGAEQLRDFVEPYGYEVRIVSVRGCLHFKTGCTYLGRDTLLVNPEWVDLAELADFRLISVDPSEPFGANALKVGSGLIYPASCPRTREKIEDEGFEVDTVDISELMKAEAGLTCMSQVFTAPRV